MYKGIVAIWGVGVEGGGGGGGGGGGPVVISAGPGSVHYPIS